MPLGLLQLFAALYLGPTSAKKTRTKYHNMNNLNAVLFSICKKRIWWGAGMFGLYETQFFTCILLAFDLRIGFLLPLFLCVLCTVQNT